MILKLLLLFFIVTSLFSLELEKKYYITSRNIMLSSITGNTQQDKILFTIPKERYTKRVKTKKLLQILQQYNLLYSKPHFAYVQFIYEPPLATKELQRSVAKFYKKYYNTLNIEKITIHPRGFIEKLPLGYSIKFPPRNYLHHKGIFSIKSDKRQIFFDYSIKATLFVYKTKQKIQKNQPLNRYNTYKTKINFKKFHTLPLEKLQPNSLQASRYLKKETLLTHKDVRALFLVKKGENINIFYKSGGISISFSAKAMQNGIFNDIIKAKNSSGKTIQVKIIGRKRGMLL